jgi:hypothetical protein
MQAKPHNRLLIDGKMVRIFLFARKSPLSGHPVLWQVEGFDKDHALGRLCEVEHWIARREWNYIEELDPEHDVGAMGRKLPLLPNGAIVRPLFSRLKH